LRSVIRDAPPALFRSKKNHYRLQHDRAANRSLKKKKGKRAFRPAMKISAIPAGIEREERSDPNIWHAFGMLKSIPEGDARN
jgi:hypothetical protein